MLVELLASGLLLFVTKESRKKDREEKARKSCICEFEDGISWIQFASFAKIGAIRFARIVDVSVDGPIVYGIASSQTGKSCWEFRIDFNDYGHLTGRYWIYSDNEDSNLPGHLAELISFMIHNPASAKKLQRTPKVSEQTKQLNSTNQSIEESKRNSHLKAKIICIMIIILAFVCLVGFLYFDHTHGIRLRISSQAAIGANYEKVMQELKNDGFTDFIVYPEPDLKLKDSRQENTIKTISIGGHTSFLVGEKYYDFTSIRIVYHTIEEIEPPITSKRAQKKDYNDIVQTFSNAGFIKIHTIPIYDLKHSWFTKDGVVEEISIDGKVDYSSDDTFRPDVEVIITYHTYE